MLDRCETVWEDAPTPTNENADVNFDKAFNFWFDYIYGGAFTAAFWLTDQLDDKCGPFVATIAVLFAMPLILIGQILGFTATAVIVVLLVVTAPITVPISICLHRRRR